jgi:hypothetical protein
MPDTPGTPKLPASGLLLAAQIRYQVRLPPEKPGS